MTIGRERYGNMEPPHVRRGLAYTGLTLIALSLPLIFPLGALATVVDAAGMLALIYAFLPSGYPLLGVMGSLAVACVPFGIAYLLLND